MSFRSLLSLTFLLLLSVNIKAQNAYCIDSLKIQYGATCVPDYIPVCGCDGVTYRNMCFADINGLISYNQGICENIAMDINPNPTFDLINVRILLKFEGDVNFYIFDHFGRRYLHRNFVRVTQVDIPLNIYNYKAGPFFFIAHTDDEMVTKIIIKQDF